MARAKTKRPAPEPKKAQPLEGELIIPKAEDPRPFNGNSFRTRPGRDPSTFGVPALLLVEVVMKTAPIKDIYEAYGLTKDDYLAHKADPDFQKALEDTAAMLQEEGMSFKMKAKLQAESFLTRSFQLVQDRTGMVPANVQADLIKATVRWAGYEPKGQGEGGMQNALQININLA